MKPFKFLTQVNENDAIEPNRFNELVNYQRTLPNEYVFVPSETTQIYTEMLRTTNPLTEMDSNQLNHLKIVQERKLLESIYETLDFRHSIISSDENGFTMRTELYL